MPFDIADGTHNSPLPLLTVNCVLHPEHKVFQYKEAKQHAQFVRHLSNRKALHKTFLVGVKKGVTDGLL